MPPPTLAMTPASLDKEANALRDAADDFKAQLGSRLQAVLGLGFRGEFATAFTDMFTDATKFFESVSVDLKAIADGLDNASITTKTAHADMALKARQLGMK